MHPFIKFPSLLCAALCLSGGICGAAQITVTSAADGGAGSLRAAVAAALAQGGNDDIVFAPALSGQIITLTGGEIAVGGQVVTVDATALPNGLTLNGNAASRHFSVPSNGTLTLRGLTLKNGKATGANGGSILSTGTLALSRCTFSGNISTMRGGAVSTDLSLVAEQCTFAGNSATAGGGAIYNLEVASLSHCTITQNSAAQGGGLMNDANATLINTIIAGNTAPAGADVYNQGTLGRTGVNLVQVSANAGAGSDSGPAAINAPPRLRPLSNYGGPVATMPPQPDSPALDRIGSAIFASDQRGLLRPMWGAADIGAVEAGTQADGAWEVREVFRSPATPLSTLNDALALISDPAATVILTTPGVINRSDPDNSGAGYFPDDEPVASDDKTPQGLINGDDNDFATIARTFINIPAEDDYTFGFISSEGARLRVFGAAFISSTRVNPANPANPAHSGDTLSFPGLTDASTTLGVCHLTTGVYAVEFVTWERTGAAFAEVMVARGAHTAVNGDGSFRLLGDVSPGGSFTAGSLAEQPLPEAWTQEFEDGTGGFTVTNINGPFEGPWTPDPVVGTWDTAGQGSEATVPPSTLLTGPAVTMHCTGAATLRFRHRFSFEEGQWDGGQIKLSVNGGPFVLVAGAAFTQGGYTGTVAITSIADIRGQEAFVLDSTGYAVPAYIESVASLGNFNAGDTLRVQFLASFDKNNRRGNPAWQIDSVSIDQTCEGGPAGWELVTIRNGADTLTTALNQVYGHWSGVPQANALVSVATTLNFQGPGNAGVHAPPPARFPGDTAVDDDQFAQGARATLYVPAAGEYTFCLLADDAARLRMPGSRSWTAVGGAAAGIFLDGFSAGGGADVLGQVFLTAGEHPIEVVYHESAGNAQIGLWAARGRHTTFDPDLFSILGGPGMMRPEPPCSLTRQSGLVRPVNDDFVAATLMAGGAVRAVVNTAGAGVEGGEPGLAGMGGTVWWQWLAPEAGACVIDTAGSDFNTVLAVYSGSSLAALTPVVANDTYGASTAARVTFAVPSAGPYMIQAGGAGAATGRLALQILPAATPANNSFAAAMSLGAVYSAGAAAFNDAATAEINEPSHVTGVPPRSSVWFTWMPPAGGNYRIDTLGSRYDTVLAVYTGSTLTSLTPVASNDDISAGVKQSAVTVTASGGTLYRIAVDGRDSAARGEVRLNIQHLPATTDPVLLAGPQPDSPRNFGLTWRSEPWSSYRIESSADLSSWSTFRQGVPSGGTSSLFDTGVVTLANPRRYFRVSRE